MDSYKFKVRFPKFQWTWPQSPLLPSPGSVIFTLLVVGGLIMVQFAGVPNLFASPSYDAASTGAIPYQGRLADVSGAPVTEVVPVVFRLYSAPAWGAPLWEENWTGSNSVIVSDGLFNVMLGSLNPIPQNLITGQNSLFLGITVNADNEMTPRVQLGSVPYAVQALTVPDASITTAKLAPDIQFIPSGAIIMWSGATNAMPAGWQVCDGSNGTPDLRDRFVVGAGSSYAVGATGGAVQVALTASQMPAHNHTGQVASGGTHRHMLNIFRDNTDSGGYAEDASSRGGQYTNYTEYDGAHSHTMTIDNTGGGQPFENRPPYYALAFICKR